MGTSHRLHDHLWIQWLRITSLGFVRTDVGLEVPVDPEPMHFPTADDLFFTDDRNVVFRLASDHAGVAAGSLVQIDRHTPLVVLVDRWFLPKRLVFKVMLDHFVRELRIL